MTKEMTSLASPSARVAKEMTFLASPSARVTKEMSFLASPSARVTKEKRFLASPSARVTKDMTFLASPSARVTKEKRFLASPSARATKEMAFLASPSAREGKGSSIGAHMLCERADDREDEATQTQRRANGRRVRPTKRRVRAHDRGERATEPRAHRHSRRDERRKPLARATDEKERGEGPSPAANVRATRRHMANVENDSTRIAVVTGANSGIGKVTAAALLRKGFRVIATARSKERGEAALADWRREIPDAKVELVLCDLSDLDSVHAAAKEIASKVDRIHVLVNNAGGIIGERRTTKSGLEETFAGNHLGPFVLTRDLMPLLERGAPARIVNVASDAHKAVSDMRWDDLQFANGYSSMKAYGQSKLANILFTRELARRLDPKKITANSVHPGVVRTRFGETGSGLLRFGIALIRPFLIDEAKGADTSIWLATDPSMEGKSGGYYVKRKLVTPTRAAQSDEGAKRLWDLSEKLAGGAASAPAAKNPPLANGVAST